VERRVNRGLLSLLGLRPEVTVYVAATVRLRRIVIE
jgi:hypothetical protein